MNLTTASILKATSPEQIFSSADAVEIEFRALAKKYHPDVNPSGAEVFKHINVLHAQAKIRFSTPTPDVWQIPGVFAFRRDTGGECHFHYVKDFDAGIGCGYVGKNNMVAYVFDADKKDLVDNAIKTIESLTKFPNDTIKKSLQPNLPKATHLIKTNDDRLVLILERPHGTIRLRDLYDHLLGKFDPKHMAWILSRCYNFVCYLEWMGIAHHDLSMDTIFVNPEYHTISIVGGWWFTSKIDQRMARLQSTRTVKYAPQPVLATKKTSASTDLELIRLLGRELMGDATGASFPKRKDVPANLAHYLRMVTCGSPRKDYDTWDETLVKAFGPKKFTRFDIKLEEVYNI